MAGGGKYTSEQGLEGTGIIAMGTPVLRIGQTFMDIYLY
jgi:hypothetical protein